VLLSLPHALLKEEKRVRHLPEAAGGADSSLTSIVQSYGGGKSAEGRGTPDERKGGQGYFYLYSAGKKEGKGGEND